MSAQIVHNEFFCFLLNAAVFINTVQQIGWADITEHGFDPMYGARPLKRYVQKTVETLAAKLILKGDINTGDDIVIDVVNGELTARAEGRKAIEEK